MSDTSKLVTPAMRPKAPSFVSNIAQFSSTQVAP